MLPGLNERMSAGYLGRWKKTSKCDPVSRLLLLLSPYM